MAVTPGSAADPNPARGRRDRRLSRDGRLRWLRRRAFRSVLGLLALSLVVSVFVAGYVHYQSALAVWPQEDPPRVRLSAAELSRFRAAAATPPGVAAAPIVLAYHDIAEHPSDRHEVSPEEFARQMAMLHAAGYRTLTGDEFVAILHGRPSPPRSVLITFDDGTQGLWTYADPILARYGFHAVALVITAQLDERAGPYYLSWSEIRRMAASGRWAFGSHTRNSHREVAVSATGPAKSELVNRQWTGAGKESFRDFQRRVDGDLRGSIRDLTSHGLPRPRLFAYPFSEAALPGHDPAALAHVMDRVAGLFDAAFSSYSPNPEPVGARTQGRRPPIIDRLPVTNSMSASELFAAMQHMRSMPVALAAPVAPGARWSTPDGRSVPVGTDGTRLTVATSKRYVAAQYAPQATGDWTRYRVSATIRGLDVPQTVTAALFARVGGSTPVRVRLSARTAQVSVTSSRGSASVVTRLVPRDSHVVAIEVFDGRTVVSVDGVTRYDRRSADSPLARGGIGVAVFRGTTAVSFPVFDGIRVTSLGRS